MIALLALIWLLAGVFVCLVFALVKAWAADREEWGAAYQHHDAMQALAPEQDAA